MGDAQLELNKPMKLPTSTPPWLTTTPTSTSPGYLLKEATARELASDIKVLLKAADRIISEYPTAQAEVGEARQSQTEK
jgi:hypothetical protein